MNEFSILPTLNPVIEGKVKPNYTVLVAGLGRGGTSLTSAVIDALGVPMDGSEDGHFERSEFKDFNGINERIKYLNNEYKSWGTQVLINDISRVRKKVRNPVLILTFRDLIAVLQRRLSANDHEDDDIQKIVINEYRRFFTIVNQLPAPKMLLSYERLKYQSEETIDHIMDYLKIQNPNKQKAMARIGTGYLLQ